LLHNIVNARQKGEVLPMKSQKFLPPRAKASELDSFSRPHKYQRADSQATEARVLGELSTMHASSFRDVEKNMKLTRAVKVFSLFFAFLRS
jgi:hypothetical protein